MNDRNICEGKGQTSWFSSAFLQSCLLRGEEPKIEAIVLASNACSPSSKQLKYES